MARVLRSRALSATGEPTGAARGASADTLTVRPSTTRHDRAATTPRLNGLIFE